MSLSFDDFDNNHVIYDKKLERFGMWNINVINVKAGQEAERVAAIFGISPNSIIHASGPEAEYVSFIADEKGNTEVVGSGERAFNVQNTFYYPDFEPYMDQLFEEYQEMAERLPNYVIDKKSIDDMYSLFGMEIIHD